MNFARRFRSVGDQPLYSRKLHMRVLRASTSCETSLMIFALSLGERVVNHFARRWKRQYHRFRQPAVGGHTTLPCRERRMRYLGYVSEPIASRSVRLRYLMAMAEWAAKDEESPALDAFRQVDPAILRQREQRLPGMPHHG